jgi:hypothetical protein
MTALGRSTAAVDAARAAPTQSRARVSVPSTDARSMPPIRARQPSRTPARMSARVLPGRARTLGIVSARDDGRSLTRAVPLRWPSVCLAPALSKDVSGRFAINARTFRDVSGRLAALARADIPGHLRTSPRATGWICRWRRRFRGAFREVLAVSTPVRTVCCCL